MSVRAHATTNFRDCGLTTASESASLPAMVNHQNRCSGFDRRGREASFRTVHHRWPLVLASRTQSAQRPVGAGVLTDGVRLRRRATWCAGIRYGKLAMRDRRGTRHRPRSTGALEFLNELRERETPASSAVFEGPFPDPEIEHFASMHDRDWFQRNPDQKLRLRTALAGEFPMLEPPQPGDRLIVEVGRIGEGVRSRTPVGWIRPLEEEHECQ